MPHDSTITTAEAPVMDFEEIASIIGISFILSIAFAYFVVTFHPFGVFCPSWEYINGMACEACSHTCRPITFGGTP